MGSESQFIYCYQLISTPGHPNGSEKHGVGELWRGGGADKPHLACSLSQPLEAAPSAAISRKWAESAILSDLLYVVLSQLM